MVHLYYLDQKVAQIDQIIKNNEQINLNPLPLPEMLVKEETRGYTQSQIDFEVNKANTNEGNILNNEETKINDQNNLGSNQKILYINLYHFFVFF